MFEVIKKVVQDNCFKNYFLISFHPSIILLILPSKTTNHPVNRTHTLFSNQSNGTNINLNLHKGKDTVEVAVVGTVVQNYLQKSDNLSVQ